MNISSDGEISLSDVKYIEDDSGPRLGAGDILFNNTNSPTLVGKSALIKGDWEFAFSNHMTRIRPYHGFDGSLLARQLHALHRFGYFKAHSKQHVNQASIPLDFLGHHVPILIPPEPEQCRLSILLEEVMARGRRARTALDEIPKLAQTLRQAILAFAYRGELTAQWRERTLEQSSTAELLSRIRKERRQHWQAAQQSRSSKQKKPRDVEADYPAPIAPGVTGLPPVPDSWSIISFDELVWSLRSGTTARARPTESPHHVLRSSSVRPGIVDCSDVAFLDEEGSSDDYISEGDLLFTRLSGSLEYVGNCAIVRNLQGRKLQYPDRLFQARVVESIEPAYVEAAFECALLRVGLEFRAKSSAGHQRISQSDLRTFPIPLPPLEEQREIVRIIEAARAPVSKLLEHTANAQRQLSEAEQAVLVKAFNGQLVAQEQSNEPATALLARLAQSQTTPAKPRERAPTQNSLNDESTLPKDGPSHLVMALRHLGGRALAKELAREAGYLPAEDEVDDKDRVRAFYVALAAAWQTKLLKDTPAPNGETWLELQRT